MKKKILFVNSQCLQRGGIQSVVMSIVRGLSKEFTFDILVFSDEKGWYDEEFLSYGGKIIRLVNYGGNNTFRRRLDLYIRWMKNYNRVKKVIMENGPYDAIHANVAFEAGYVLKAAFANKIPVRLAHTHVITNIPPKKIIMRGYSFFELKLIKKYATKLIGCTQEACESMFGTNGNWTLMRNPYDERRFDSRRFQNISEFKSPVLIHIASYSSNKNQLFTVDILKHLVSVYPNAKLLLEGYELEPGYLSLIKEKVKIEGLQKNIFFYPPDADSPALLNSSTYFIFPSKFEGFGIAPVEAQAMGLRCFISDSVPHLSDCGGCTFLPLKDGAEMWAKTLAADFEKTRGKHSTYDCSTFSTKNILDDYRKIYNHPGMKK